MFDDFDWEMNRILLIPIWALTVCAFCVCNQPVMAQEADPFGGVDDTSDVAAPEPADTPEDKDARPELASLEKGVRLIVSSVRSSNPSTPRKLAEAVRTMMDLEQYEEAKFYLDQLRRSPLDEAALFDLNQSVGADFFFRLARSRNMAPAGTEFANRVILSANKTAHAPARVQEFIGKLSHENIAVRSDAARELRRLGESAIAQMIDVFADESRSNQFDSIRAALRVMGEPGLAPLIAATKSSNEQVQFESVLALASIKHPDAFDAIVGSYYSSSTSKRVKEAASKAFVDQYGYFPDVLRASSIWYKRSNQLLDDSLEMGARRLGFSATPANVWRWDSVQNKLARYQLTLVASRRILAADKAEVLAEINADNAEYQQFRLLTLLEARKQLVGPSRSMDADMIRKLLPNVTAQEVNLVLENALERGLVPAAIGACEVLESMADPEVLSSGSHRPCPLIQSILFGDRHLQYAALRAISAIDPQRNFAGSSYVAQCAVYMASYADRPGALVGSSREDLARTLAARMIPSGLNGLTATNGRDFYRSATRDANLQFLLICDTFHRPDYIEIVQQLRQDWRTRRLPIAILYRQENARRAMRVADKDALTVAMPFTVDPELVALQIQQLQQFSSVWPVTLDDRQVHSRFALEWLAKVTKGGDTYSFLNLASHESQLSKLIFSRGLEETATQVISALGTPNSQRVLVNYASELALPIENRRYAATAFKTSVQQNGILLTSSEILKQYDRYNASETDTVESQKVLGSILDSIEAPTRSSNEPVNADD